MSTEIPNDIGNGDNWELDYCYREFLTVQLYQLSHTLGNEDKNSTGMEITTVPSSAVHTEPVDELQKELTESPKNDVKGDSSKILDSNLRCAMLLDRMEASPLKDLDDEVLASPYTSIRRAQKDYGISSPRSNRKVS